MLIKKKNGLVTFVFEQHLDTPIYLTGDFNSWEKTALPLKKEDNAWTITIELDPGAYQFKYYTKTNDGQEQWFNDWKADAYIASPYGGENSVVIVED